MAHAEPAVRHALIALAYLHSTEDGSMRHARSRFASQRESKFLLSHYNKSVRGLVDRIGEAKYSHEIGLVTCLLFVCMEFLRGNYHTAFTHLTNGLSIIFENRGEARHDSPFSSGSNVSETSCSESQTGLVKSTLIENELKPIFVRTMASALLYGVDVSSSIPAPSVLDYQGLIFTNIRDVQQSAHGLRNQSIVQIHRMSRSLYYTPELGFTTDELAQQRTVLSCQDAWYAALQKFWQEHRLSKTDELAISVMLIHHYSVNIWTICTPLVRETAFDEHLGLFKLIVHHARLVLDSMDLRSPQNAAWYTFEVSVIPTLYWVGTRCRCPTTRREAVSLLARNPPREGLWDAAQHVLVARRVIEMEEKEVDATTGWPVEHTRMWSCVINADMDQTGGFWAYFMPIVWLHERTPDGKPKALSEFFSMYVPPLDAEVLSSNVSSRNDLSRLGASSYRTPNSDNAHS
jgi:hypothetical protein